MTKILSATLLLLAIANPAIATNSGTNPAIATDDYLPPKNAPATFEVAVGTDEIDIIYQNQAVEEGKKYLLQELEQQKQRASELDQLILEYNQLQEQQTQQNSELKQLQEQQMQRIGRLEQLLLESNQRQERQMNELRQLIMESTQQQDE